MSAPPISPPLQTILADIRNAQDYAALAPHFMPPSQHAYISGGSGYGQSVAANNAHMLKLLREELREELEICMAMAGCATINEINSGALLR